MNKRRSFVCPLGCISASGRVFRTKKEAVYLAHLGSKRHRSHAHDLLKEEKEKLEGPHSIEEQSISFEEQPDENEHYISPPLILQEENNEIERENNDTYGYDTPHSFLSHLWCSEEEFEENRKKYFIREATDDDQKLLQLYSLYLNKQIPRATLKAMIDTFSQPLWNTNLPKFNTSKILTQIPERLAECGVRETILFFSVTSF